MEFFYMVMPLSGLVVFWPGLIVLGLAVGIIGGFFGLGGAWIFTPGLYILGFPMTWAIGTTIAEVAGKSLLTSLRHGTFSNLDVSLGLTMLIGTVTGVEAGARLAMWLERAGRVDIVVLGIYGVLLAFLCWLVLHDALARHNQLAAGSEAADNSRQMTAPANALLQRLRLPPVIHYKKANITCSVWGPLLICLATGFLAGLLGIGGGLLRMPALVYLAGFPTHLAQGTDLLEAAVSGIYGTSTYVAKMRVEPYAALILVFFAAAGNQIGSLATRYVKGHGIRAVFGLTCLACLAGVLIKLVELFVPDLAWLLSPAARIELLCCTSLLALYITWRLLRGYCKHQEEKPCA